MAIVTTDDKHYKDIAATLRRCSGNDRKWRPEDMTHGIEIACGTNWNTGYSEGHESGFNEGVTAGRVEGKRAEYDRFWDAFQNYGKNASYSCAFYGNRWTDDLYNPKYTFVTNNCNQMFYSNTMLTDTKVPIDISKGGQTHYLFQGATAMKTIRELIVSDEKSWTNMFLNCTSLENITITGTVSKNIDFQWSPLTADSMRHLVSVLSDTAEGQTITFNKAAKEAAFTEDEWETLIETKPNWTFSLV